jgi:hypothetical protein
MEKRHGIKGVSSANGILAKDETSKTYSKQKHIEI